MKTLTFTIAAVLTLQAGILLAGNDSSPAPATNESMTITLAPSVPVVATFEEFETTVTDVAVFAPAMPIEADFSDAIPVLDFGMLQLAPVTPAEADFNDAEGMIAGIDALYPVTPVVADFE